MDVTTETLTPTRVRLTVTVPFEELSPVVDAAYKKVSGQIRVPGFRPGRVPRQLVDQRVGRAAVLDEALQEALPRFYGQAVEDNKVRPVGQPEVDLTEVPVKDGDELKFSIEVDVRPEITLPDYSNIRVEVDPVAGAEDEMQERLTTLRQRFGTLTGVDRAAESGDFVSIDLTARIGGEDIDTVTGVSYEIGTGNMVEGLDEALVGMSAGESTTFGAPLAGGDRAGEEAQITVTVSSVKERVLPDLDDEFAQLASEFDTLEELTADLQVQAERAKRFEQGLQARDRVLDHLMESTEVPVPDGLVEAEVRQHLEGEDRLEDEEHRAEVTESTRTALRSQFLLDAIAEKEQVSVGQQELIEYLVTQAQQYGMEPNDFAKAVDENGQIPAMVGEVARRKALASVLENASVVDTDGVEVDLNTLVAPGEDGQFADAPDLDEEDEELGGDPEADILTGGAASGVEFDDDVIPGEVLSSDVGEPAVLEGASEQSAPEEPAAQPGPETAEQALEPHGHDHDRESTGADAPTAS